MRSPEGSTYKAKDGKRWVARYRYTDVKGVYREKKRYCLTHKLAKAKIQELKAEANAEHLSSDRVTFRQLDSFYRKEYVHAAKFVGGRKVSGFRQNILAVNYYLDGALEFFKDRPIDEITYADLRAFKAKIAGTPTIHGRVRSVSDTNQFLKRLRRLFTVAVEQGWVSVSLFNRGSSLITESFETNRTRVLSSEEETRLLAACTGKRRHLVPLIVFAIETGCRRGEILAVKWSAVNWQRRYIEIESSSTKTLRSRLVPISFRLLETLKHLRHNSTTVLDVPIFGDYDFKRAFNSACTASGLGDVHFHDLRHTAITRMLEKGISPPLVMKISGHTQYKTFLRYVNQTETSLYEIALQLDAAA